jgi:cytochrome b561
MQLKNTDNHFGIIAILLHWVMAVLIIALLVLGLYMVGIPISLEKLKLYGWHKEYGMLVLMLVVLRFALRFASISPSLNELPLLERIAARTVHWAFYLFMFAIPLTGWLITSAAGLPVSFFGLFVFPDLIGSNPDQMVLFEEIHKWLGYGLIATIVLHTSAALKHHFINKDDILRRML